MGRFRNRKIAFLLAVSLLVCDCVPALAAENRDVKDPGAAVETEAADEAVKTGETPEGETVTVSRNEEVSSDTGVQVPTAGEEAPAEDPAGEQEQVSSDAADGTVSLNESVSGPEAVEDGEQPAGEITGTKVSAPGKWKVTQADSAEWYETSQGHYNVYFKKSGVIGFYPESKNDDNSAEVTVLKDPNVTTDVDVIVEGGDYAPGTAVTVDSSLSGHVFVHHESIVEKNDSFILVEGGTDDDYEIGDKNTVPYESGWMVNKRQDDYWIRVDYKEDYLRFFHDRARDIRIIRTWNKEEFSEPYHTSSTGDYFSFSNAPSEMIDDTSSVSRDYVVKTVDSGYNWLHINKRTELPKTGELQLEMKKITDAYGSGVGIYKNGELYDSSKDNDHSTYKYRVSGNYGYSRNYSEFWLCGETIHGYQLGALGCNYELWAKNTSDTGFSSGWSKVNSVSPVYVTFDKPQKKSIAEINMTGSEICLVADHDESYYSAYYSDTRGTSRLKFIIADKDTPVETVGGQESQKWKYASGSAYTNRSLHFDKSLSSSGSFETLRDGREVDVYAAWFLPFLSDVSDSEGNGNMVGEPVKLYSLTFNGRDSIVNPEIRYNDTTYDTDIEKEFTEDGSLFTDEEIERCFKAYTADESHKTLNGEFRIRAISKNDPQAEAFLAQTTLSEGSLGRDVTESGRWDRGEYYMLAYFEPIDPGYDGNYVLSAVKQFDLTVKPRKVYVSAVIEGSSTVYAKLGETLDISDKLKPRASYNIEEYDAEKGYTTYKNVDISDKINNPEYIVRVVSGDKVNKGKGEYDPDWEYPYDRYYETEGGRTRVSFDCFADQRGFRLLVYLKSFDFVIEDPEDYDYDLQVYDYLDERSYPVTKENIEKCSRHSEYGGYWDTSMTAYVLEPGEVTAVKKTDEIPYGIINQLRTDEIEKTYSKRESFFRDQIGRIIGVSSNGQDIKGRMMEKALKYSFATAEDGEYKSIGELSAADLEFGKTIWIKASIVGVSSDALSFKIGRQSVNIASVCPVISDPGADLKTSYSDDIYIYYLNPYPNENSSREIRAKLSDWNDGASVALNTGNVDKNKPGFSVKTSMAISLNPSKSAIYEVRSTAAMYIIRSAGALDTPIDNREDIVRDRITVQFVDAKTGKKIANTADWFRDQALPSAYKPEDKKYNSTADFDSWSIGGDCSDIKIDVTAENLVTTSGSDYVFNISKALELLKGESISVITFYGYKTEEVSKYIKVNEIAPVSYNGKAHVAVGSKGNNSADLFISVYLVAGTEKILLKEGTDYTLKYKNNKEAGEGSVTVTGKGAYKGLSTVRSFKIYPASLKNAAAVVNSSYKYNTKGVPVSPKVLYGTKTLKNGENKDYVFELTDVSGNSDTGSYDKNSPAKRFRVKVTGKNNYSGQILSEPFWGIPSNLKPLGVTMGNTSVRYVEDTKTFVTAEDYFSKADGKSKATNFDGEVKASLYDDKYIPLEKGVDTGKYYYVGIEPVDPDAAIAKGLSPAAVFKKVRFLGLNFNKNLVTLDYGNMDFDNSNKTVTLKAKGSSKVAWEDVQVTFSDYYTPDGNDDLPLDKGVKEPAANNGGADRNLDNLYPGTYSVFVTGTGRYSGTFTLTYRVKPVRAKIGQNVVVRVNGGKDVVYNASGYDTGNVPVEIFFKDGEKTVPFKKGVYSSVVFAKKSSVKNGGQVNVTGIYSSTGVKVFTGSIREGFKVVPCDLKEALSLSSDQFGSIRKSTINLGARVPLLYLYQKGALGFKDIGNAEFEVTEDIKKKAESGKKFDLNVKALDRNYTGGEFVIKDVDAYKETHKKAGLSLSPGNKAELENGGGYGSKNSKANTYYAYTGTAVEPGIIVKDKAGNVISEEYYDVTYTNNIYPSTNKEHAIATVEFKRSEKSGEFPYGGTAQVDFYIVSDYSK